MVAGTVGLPHVAQFESNILLMHLAVDDLLDVVKEVERRAEQAGTLGLLIELHQEDAALVHDQGRLLEQLVVVDLHALRVEGLRARIFERELAGRLLLTRPPQRLHCFGLLTIFDKVIYRLFS